MTKVELTDREYELVLFHRMTPRQQAARMAELRENARLAALAQLTPERRVIAEQRYADQQAAIAAEQERVAALSPDERSAEIALRQKASAEATLAVLPTAVVDQMTADAVTVEKEPASRIGG